MKQLPTRDVECPVCLAEPHGPCLTAKDSPLRHGRLHSARKGPPPAAPREGELILVALGHGTQLARVMEIIGQSMIVTKWADSSKSWQQPRTVPMSRFAGRPSGHDRRLLHYAAITAGEHFDAERLRKRLAQGMDLQTALTKPYLPPKARTR